MCPFDLHIPAPPTRPGDEPDFSHLVIPPPGAVPRPEADVNASSESLRDTAYGLIRVLDNQGHAAGPWAPRIAPEKLRQGLRAMLLTRLFEDRMFRSHRQGKTSFFMKSTGEEAIGAAQSMVLGPRDMCFPTYRVLSWLMARGYPLHLRRRRMKFPGPGALSRRLPPSPAWAHCRSTGKCWTRPISSKPSEF